LTSFSSAASATVCGHLRIPVLSARARGVAELGLAGLLGHAVDLLEVDLTKGGSASACSASRCYDDGGVKHLNVEAPGKFEVSDAETMLKQLD
jgi:hypothetical protein